MKVSSSAVAKTIKCYDETGSHEDLHRKIIPRVTSAVENEFIRVTSLRNRQLTAPQIAQVTDTSQHQLFRGDCVKSGLHGQIAAKKTPIRKRDLLVPTPEMDMRPVEMCPLVWSPYRRFLVPNAVSLRDVVWVNR